MKREREKKIRSCTQNVHTNTIGFVKKKKKKEKEDDKRKEIQKANDKPNLCSRMW